MHCSTDWPNSPTQLEENRWYGDTMMVSVGLILCWGSSRTTLSRPLVCRVCQSWSVQCQRSQGESDKLREREGEWERYGDHDLATHYSTHTQCFSHSLVHVNGVCVLHELSDYLSLFILHHQHLLWFSHSTDHHKPNLSKPVKSSKNQSHTLQLEQLLLLFPFLSQRDQL